MKVKVLKKFGTYNTGEEVEMHESTAKAVAKHGHVELIEGSKDTTQKGGKKK